MNGWRLASGVAAWCSVGWSPAVAASPAAEDRAPRGEVLVDAADPSGPDQARTVHGEARLGFGLGFVLEDPVAALAPSIELDLRRLAPVRLVLGAAFRLRMVDRAPDQRGVLRREEWNEVGDFVAILQRLEWSESYAFGRTGSASIDLRVGALGRVQLGHGSLIRNYHNGLDIDRPRSGLDAAGIVEGQLLEQPASIEWALMAGDLAGSQVLGARVGGRWAGAGLGIQAVGDPTAPHALVPNEQAGFDADARGRLETSGRRGAAGLGLDLSYLATDDWRWSVLPYLDLVWMPTLGRGLHTGLDAEGVLGRRRRVRLGAVAELTYGSSGYDPGYFDLFYLYQRWQVPFYARPDDAPDDVATTAVPKHRFVRDADLGGVGGSGAVRFAHQEGAFAEFGYAYRPGPWGHTAHLRVGVDLPVVSLFAVYGHRGQDHGFEPRAAGTVARLDLRVPVLRYLDVEVSTGWMFAIRPHPGGSDDAYVTTGGGFGLAGVAGRVPW